MPEKFRRIKKREPRSPKYFLQKQFLVAGLVLIVAVGMASWFYLRLDISNQNSPDQAKKIDRALAAVICRTGECFWLNKEGISFDKSGQTGGNLVLSLEDKTGRELKIGSELLNSHTLTELSFLRQRIYEDLGLSLRAGQVDDANFSDFNFVTKEGWTLKISISQNAYKTLETLKQTLAEIKKTAPTSGLEYVDLRVPNKVYYKFR